MPSVSSLTSMSVLPVLFSAAYQALGAALDVLPNRVSP
jgi:hypothetical protein